MDDYMLSTDDNPYNPFTDFDEWYAFDLRAGHNSLSLLARVIVTSDELSEADQEDAYHEAVDEIIRMDLKGVHIRVFNPNRVPESSLE